MEDAVKKNTEKMPEPGQNQSKKRHRKKKNRQTKPAALVNTEKQPSAAQEKSGTQSAGAPKKPETAGDAAAVSETAAGSGNPEAAKMPAGAPEAEPEQAAAAAESKPEAKKEDAKDSSAAVKEKAVSAESGKDAAGTSADAAAKSKEEPINVVVKPDAAEASRTEQSGVKPDKKSADQEKPEITSDRTDAKAAAADSEKNAEARRKPHDHVLIYHPEEFRQPLDWIKMILNPQSCQEKEAEFNSEYCRDGILLIVIKCAVIALVLATLIAKVLNRYSFSYVRMTFTGASWLAVRLFLILAVAEVAYIGVTYLFHIIWKKPISCNRLVRVVGAGSLSSAAAYLIGGLLGSAYAPLGAVAMIGAITYSVILKTFGTAFLSSLTRRKQLICVCFAYCAMALFVLIGFHLFAGDLVRAWNDLIAF